MARIERTLPAVEDMLVIWTYIAKANVNAADALIDRFGEILDLLSRNARLGVPVPQYRPGLFRFVVGDYLLFYEPLPDGVRLMRVLHSSRKLEELI
jgi:toxin ParE1/3/4